MKRTIIAGLLLVSAALPAAANDSVQRGSAASVGASVLAASTAGWIAYKGSEFTVKAVEVAGDGVSLALRGVSDGVETVARVSTDAARAGSVTVGTSVRVVAESTGYALMAGSTLLAFVPNEIGRSLLHHSRY